MKSSLLLLALLLGLSTSAYAENLCETQLKERILFAYNDGGMQVTKLLGPYSEDLGFFDQAGNPGLKFLVTYVVAYKWDAEFNKKPGSVKITAECAADAEPIQLIDLNKDGIFDLTDTYKVVSESH